MTRRTTGGPSGGNPPHGGPPRPRHLRLLNTPASELARAPARPHREAVTSQLLKTALSTPNDDTQWRVLHDAAMREGNLELARRATRALGDAGIPLEADIALAEGRVAQALVLVQDRPDRESRLRLAWSLFYLGQRAAAATAWLLSGGEPEGELGRTLSALLKGRPAAELEPALRKLADVEPRYVAAAAARLLAEFHAEAQDHARAISWARRAEWMMPHDASLKRLLARAYAASKNVEAATARWREVLNLAPEDAEAHEMLGHTARERQDLDTAVEHYIQALAIDPFRGSLRVILGDIARDRGKEEEAIEHWETALRLDPKDREVLTRLAEHAWDSGDVTVALDLYLDLRKLGFPDDEEEEHLEMIGYLYSEVLLGGNDKKAKEAATFFESARKRFPKNPFLLLYDARRLISREKFADARPLVAQVLKDNPLMPEAVFEMGHLLLEEGKQKEGMELLHRAETLDPDPFYKKELGRHYLHAESWAQAEKWLKKALSSGVEDEELLLALHTACYYQRKYSLCENLLRRALTIFPDNMQALTYLSEILLLLGRIEEAMGILKTVTEMAITFEEFQAGRGAAELVVEPAGCVDWLLGYALFFSGDARAADKQFRRGHKIDERLPQWFEGLRGMLVARLEAEPALARKFGCANFFTEP